MCSTLDITGGVLYFAWVIPAAAVLLLLGIALVPFLASIAIPMSAKRSPGAGCHLRYLPSSSPDFNPIELAFSKLKTHLRGVAARSFEPLLAAIGKGLDGITPADSRGYDDHCGFPLPEPDEQSS